MANFEYRDEDHTYWLNGIRIPGTTEIIKSADLIDDTNFTPESRDRGTRIHRAILYWLQKDLNERSVCESDLRYLDAFKRFVAETGFKASVKECEQPRYHPVYLFGGTIDIVGKLSGHYVLIDIKTGFPQPWHGLQLAAYLLLVHVPPERYGLYLRSDGTYRLESYNNRNDSKIFLSALTLYGWRKEKGLLK